MFKMKPFYNLVFSSSIIVFPTFPQLKTNSLKNVCLQPGLLPEVHSCHMPTAQEHLPSSLQRKRTVLNHNRDLLLTLHKGHHPFAWLGLLPCLLYLAVCPNILIKNVRMSSVCFFIPAFCLLSGASPPLRTHS